MNRNWRVQMKWCKHGWLVAWPVVVVTVLMIGNACQRARQANGGSVGESATATQGTDTNGGWTEAEIAQMRKDLAARLGEEQDATGPEAESPQGKSSPERLRDAEGFSEAETPSRLGKEEAEDAKGRMEAVRRRDKATADDQPASEQSSSEEDQAEAIQPEKSPSGDSSSARAPSSTPAESESPKQLEQPSDDESGETKSIDKAEGESPDSTGPSSETAGQKQGGSSPDSSASAAEEAGDASSSAPGLLSGVNETDETDDAQADGASQEGPSLAERLAGKKRLFSFEARSTPMQQALAQFAKQNNLNIVPDPGVTGQVTVAIRQLPLSQAMEALLSAHDYAWEMQNGLIRVHDIVTETFQVDYLQLVRSGQGSSFVTLSSGMGGGAGGGTGGAGGGMSGGGGGFGGGGQSGGGQGGGEQGGASGGGGSTMSVQQQNQIEFWSELETQLQSLTTLDENLVINKTAGVIQVTDKPDVIERIKTYLDSLTEVVHRQVAIEAKIYDVSLSEKFQLGIDWQQVVEEADLQASAQTIVNNPMGQAGTSPAAIQINFDDQDDTEAVLEALKEQGEVNVVSQPRLRTLHNQTAIIKVGTERPFFETRTETLIGESGSSQGPTVEVNMITVGTILALTPQISESDWITLDVSPVITSLLDTESRTVQSGGLIASATAPVLDIKQASTLVRVQDGDTVVLGGLIKDTNTRTRRGIPLLGDIPWLGKLFQGTFQFDQKTELVMFLTPRIVGKEGAPVNAQVGKPRPTISEPPPSAEIFDRQDR